MNFAMPKFEWTVDSIGLEIENFLDPLLDAADLDLNYEIYEVEQKEASIGPDIAVDFDGDDTDLLLNRRGELLLALEHLTLEALGVPHEDRYRLNFDSNEYRLHRIKELCMSALKAAERVKRTGKRFEFNPMTSRERRIIHVALRDIDEITTTSEGIPPRRYTVVMPRNNPD